MKNSSRSCHRHSCRHYFHGNNSTTTVWRSQAIIPNDRQRLLIGTKSRKAPTSKRDICGRRTPFGESKSRLCPHWCWMPFVTTRVNPTSRQHFPPSRAISLFLACQVAVSENAASRIYTSCTRHSWYNERAGVEGLPFWAQVFCMIFVISEPKAHLFVGDLGRVSGSLGAQAEPLRAIAADHVSEQIPCS